MTFDVANFLKHMNAQVEIYMTHIFEDITTKNPKWVENLQKDKDLFNEDGTPKQDLTKELVDEKVKSIISSADFSGYNFDMDEVKKRFIVDEELLKKFIID